MLLTDISSQDIFYLFLLKSAFDHKLVISVYRPTVNKRRTGQKQTLNFRNCIHMIHLSKNDTKSKYSAFMNFIVVYTNVPCSQLSQQESEEMFRLTMQPVMKNEKGQFVQKASKYQSELGRTAAVCDVSVCQAHSLQMSVKLTKEVFLVPTRTT